MPAGCQRSQYETCSESVATPADRETTDYKDQAERQHSQSRTLRDVTAAQELKLVEFAVDPSLGQELRVRAERHEASLVENSDTVSVLN